MKRKTYVCIALVILLIAVLALPAFAQTSAGESGGKEAPSVPAIGMNMIFTDTGGKPLAETEVFLQEDVDTEYVYNGVTDKDGRFSLPSVPISDFQLITKDKEDNLTGAVKVHLYPADQTEIIGRPENVVEPINLARSKNAALLTGKTASIATNGPLVPESLEAYTYEVNVNQKAMAVDFVFQVPADGKILMTGAADGVLPEPTPEPTGEPAPTMEPTPTLEPTIEPTKEPAPTEEPTPQPTEQPTAAPTPTAPMPTATAMPTAAPTTAPTPVPTAAPTTPPERVNLKLYLMDAKGNALPGYFASIGDHHQGMANATGTVYFSNIDPDAVETMQVYDHDTDVRGRCKVTFVEGETTAVSQKDHVYVVTYQQGTQDIYMSTDVNTDGNENTELVLLKASARPMAHGGTANDDKKDQPAELAGEPGISGYLVDAKGLPAIGATVESLNTENHGMLSGVTDDSGYFEISALSNGNHKITATAEDGTYIGQVKFTVQEADATGIVSRNGKLILSIAKGAKEVYLNLVADGAGTLTISDVSDTAAIKPAQETASPSPTTSPAPLPADAQGGGIAPLVVIVVIIAAAAAALLAVFMVKRSKGRRGASDDRNRL